MDAAPWAGRPHLRVGADQDVQIRWHAVKREFLGNVSAGLPLSSVGATIDVRILHVSVCRLREQLTVRSIVLYLKQSCVGWAAGTCER